MFVKSKLNSMLGQGLIAVLVMLLTFPFGMNRLHAQGAGGSQSGLPPQDLEKLVGPIALYPDDLVGIVLPASTNALQIVSAARFLEKRKKDPNLQPDKKWDPSVLGLLNYPEVIEMMNKDLEWTQSLGDAVINQQKDVMNAIQSFRTKAQAVGNLKTNEKQVIIVEKEIIKIVSADPQVIYVPTYQPTTIIYTSTPVYYAPARPVYWSTGAAFFTGMFVGSAIRYGAGWRRGSVDINRSVNISGGDRTTNIGGGAGGPGGRGGARTQQWKPGQGSKQRTAARTGGSPSQRPGGAGGAGGRGGASARTGQRGKGGGQQARAGSQPSRSRGNSMTGGYKSGSSARASSSRGSNSRASSGRGGRSRGGGGRSRGGGGRSRGGGGRRR